MKPEIRDVASTIPFLRRYARALTGSQERGDGYVRLCLETVLQEPQRLDASGELKIDLFRAFHEVWQGVGRSLAAGGLNLENDDEDGLQRGLASLPQRERQVLLLVSLEGFTVTQVAAILGIDAAEAGGHLAAARRELRRSTGARVLVIEDEAVIAMNIANVVRAAGHTVVATAATRDRAVALANEHQPNLILSDVRLLNGDNGIDAVREILRAARVPVIFITAFPQALLTGEGVEPAFVIAKPFDEDVLSAAIGQALWLNQPPADAGASAIGSQAHR